MAGNSAQLQQWIEDYFYRALDWVVAADDFVVDTTLVGVAMNGLSHLVGISCKSEFACALMRGLGANVGVATREAFAKEVSDSLCVIGSLCYWGRSLCVIGEKLVCYWGGACVSLGGA